MKNTYYTLADICNEIGISLATGRNWERLNKIKSDQNGFYSEDYLFNLKRRIDENEFDALKKRRNKKYISGNKAYNSYVLEDSPNQVSIKELLNIIDEKKTEITDELIKILIANAACMLCNQKAFVESIFDIKKKDGMQQKYNEILSVNFSHVKNEDTLGLIYQSCNNFRKRKAKGAYYTPTRVVKRLISLTFDSSNVDKKICDPCCGTGNFILQLPDEINYEQVYGNDIDELAVKIARINFAIKYNMFDKKTIEEHITCKNYLVSDFDKFDIFIGNPPWGSEFTNEDYNYFKKNYYVATKKNIEAYDLALEKAINSVEENGIISFVLPESILFVNGHVKIREVLLEKCRIEAVSFLGNAFDGVQCPCILIKIRRITKGFTTKNLQVEKHDEVFVIKNDRDVTSKIFDFFYNDDDYKIIHDIYSSKKVVFLKNKAIWGLGIVSGNNKKYVSEFETSNNEPIIKGTDIQKYIYKDRQHYIEYNREELQQVADESIYRAKEKLLYKFISDKLVFAYDDKKRVTLNSCNIVIPQIEGLDMKYVLAVLNSSMAQFIYKNKFHSVKVLKSYLEEIPIPLAEKNEQEEIVKLVDRVIDGETNKIEEIDRKVHKLYEKSRIN